MNYENVVEFLSSYSLPTIIISLIVTVVCVTLKLVLKEKLPVKLETYLPALLAVLLQFIYDCIFVFNRITFCLDTLYAGIICSSLSTVFTVSFFRLKRGESLDKTPLFLLLEGIISGYVKKNSLEKVINLVSSFLAQNCSEVDTLKNISTTINKYKSQQINDGDLERLSKHIIESAKGLKE